MKVAMKMALDQQEQTNMAMIRRIEGLEARRKVAFKEEETTGEDKERSGAKEKKERVDPDERHFRRVDKLSDPKGFRTWGSGRILPPLYMRVAVSALIKSKARWALAA